MVNAQQEHVGKRHAVMIGDALLREAQQVLGTPSIRATIEHSLRETVRRRRLRAFADALGTFEMDMTTEELLDLRSREAKKHLRGDA